MRRIFQSPIFEGISEDAFHKKGLPHYLCPPGEKNIGNLRPDLFQYHRFYIDFDENDNITKLVIAKTGEKYSHFTIYVNNDGTYWAHVCYRFSLLFEKLVKEG